MEVIKKNIILLGDGAVGKTSLIRRYVTDQFSDKYITTIGSKVVKKEVYFGTGDDATQMILLIWDILGQKGYRYTQALSFGGIEGALLVADVTRKSTLESLEEYWIPSLESVAGPVPMIFLGNKWDLREDAEFEEEELQDLASKFNAFTLDKNVIMTSAKTGSGVNDTFHSLAETILHMTSKAVADLETPLYIIDKNDIRSLMDLSDHIIADFCNQFGGIENASPIIKQQIERVELNINYPEKKKLVEFVNALANVEKSFRTPSEVNLNRTKRLYLINEF